MATKSPDAGSGTSAKKTASPTAAATPPTPTADQISAMYPGFGGLLNANPEIKMLLTEAASQGWTPQQLQAKLVGTDWWKNTSDTQRQWEYTKLVDPATATRQSNAMALQILQDAGQSGANVTLPMAALIAEAALGNGWDATRIAQEVAKYTHPGSGGTVGAEQTNLKSIAAQQGLNLSDGTTFEWARNIATGMADEKGFSEYAKQQAINLHPYWEKEISAGQTVRQLADPYLQQASQLLEVSPDTINLSDRKWDFTTKGKDGTQVPMSQSQWAQKIMSDPQYGWDHTQNAKSDAFNVVAQLRQSFGAG